MVTPIFDAPLRKAGPCLRQTNSSPTSREMRAFGFKFLVFPRTSYNIYLCTNVLDISRYRILLRGTSRIGAESNVEEYCWRPSDAHASTSGETPV